MSYAPADSMACCTGNVNRFFPNFIARSWMQDGSVLAPFVYAPTEMETKIEGNTVKISEITEYPFKNTVKFEIEAEKSTEFTLKLRVPNWAIKSTLKVNGKESEEFLNGNVYEIKRNFSDGDVVEISFEDKIEFIENAGGISVKKGALLYALPIKENKVIEKEVRGLGNPEYPHFSLYADSKWNFGLDRNSQKSAKFGGEITGKMPWKQSDNEMSITLDAVEVKNWDIVHKTKVRNYPNPRKKGRMIDLKCAFTPLVPEKNTFECGNVETAKLVPYCTTRLRIAIFPVKEN